MSILGRIAGFAVVGPIGAMGPTEASKRAKAQKKLLEEQNRHLARIAEGTTATPAAPTTYRPQAPREVVKYDYAVGDRVVVTNSSNRLGISAGRQGTVLKPGNKNGLVPRIEWDSGRRGRIAFDDIRPLSTSTITPELPPPPA